MSLAEARRTLAAQQSRLVRALTEDGCPTEGIDDTRFQAAAEALARKRARAVARAWPRLARALGEQFSSLFAGFAAATPLPRQGGPLADGRAFARYLARARSLPDEGRLEALGVDLAYVPTLQGLACRRGLAILWTMLRHPRRLVVAMRLGPLGAKWLTIPLGW